MRSRKIKTSFTNQENSNPKTDGFISNGENISGWEHDKPLVEHNLNTFITKLNSFKENSKPTHIKNLTYDHQRRYRPSKSKELENPQTQKYVKETIEGSERNCEVLDYSEFDENGFVDLQPQIRKKLKFEFSNFEMLKEEAKCLENEEITKSRFPNFQQSLITNHSSIFLNSYKENEEENHEALSMKRKIRTESTKRSENNNFIKGVGVKGPKTVSSGNNRFYSTMASEWLRTDSHAEIEEEKEKNNFNSSFHSKELKLDVSSILKQNRASSACKSRNQNFEQEHTAIHCCKNQSFVKYFKHKKHNPNQYSSKTSSNIPHQSKAKEKSHVQLLKHIEGRRLNQLLQSKKQLLIYEGNYVKDPTTN